MDRRPGARYHAAMQRVPDTVPEMTAELAELMRTRLGIRGGEGLEGKLRRAGRLLPRRLRRDGHLLVEAERRATHPKLARRMDLAACRAAHGRLKAHLQAIDPADRRRGMILGILAPLAFNLLLLGAALVASLVWTGRV